MNSTTTPRRLRLIGIFLIAFVGLAGALSLGGAAAAHHPELSSTVERECGPYATWSGTVTARSDRDWNKDWRNRHRIDGGPLSAWSGLTDDQVPYTFDVGPFAADVDEVVVTVSSEWYIKNSGPYSAGATRSTTLVRPAETECTNQTTPATPAVTYDCATDTLAIVGADDTTAVDYTIDITTAPTGENTPWAVTITATPQPGYEFAPDATTEWNFTGTVDCLDTTTPATPAVTYDCATDTLAIVGADDTTAVDYTIDITTAPTGENTPWAVTITATPQPGYEFAPDATTEWNFTGTVDCLDTTTPATPVLTCEDGSLALRLPTSSDYTYAVGGDLDADEGEAYRITVTASPADGFEFPSSATSQWIFTGTVRCSDVDQQPPGPATTIVSGSSDTATTTTTTAMLQPSGTLPRTGNTSTSLLIGYAAIVTLLGGLLQLVTRTVRRP